jgi:hypothetical protein
MTRSPRVLIVAGIGSLLASGLSAAQAPDVTGEWLRISENERDPASVGGRPDLGDVTQNRGDAADSTPVSEMPLNDSARLAMETNPGRHSRIEDQCPMYPPEFLMVGSFPRTVLIEIDEEENGEVKSYRIRGDRMGERVIFMDDRPHPSAHARHTPAGFSTGHWMGNALVVDTTHLQWFWEERSNVPYSDLRTLTERFERIGNALIQTMTIHDPVFLVEPVTRSREFRLEMEPVGLPDQRCSIALELAAQPRGYVPHRLPAIRPPTR